jgi:hypothetical protein
MEASLRLLMEGLIDYAGLFPPASLDMQSAVGNYAAYRTGPQSSWLGRFVLPASRLGELAEAMNRLEAPPGKDPSPWGLSALIGDDLSADLDSIERFHRNSRLHLHPAFVDAVEMKASKESDIRQAIGKIPQSITAYFEIPIHADPAPLIAAIGRARARAKVRTGGVTPDPFPDPGHLARFIRACARANVPFKATAGLHHPVRSLRRLTYAPDSGRTIMHGFLNVFLAACFARYGMEEKELADLLKEESLAAFAFGRDRAAWLGHEISGTRLQDARREFAIAFGSCSFDEPRQDLEEAGLS